MNSEFYDGPIFAHEDYSYYLTSEVDKTRNKINKYIQLYKLNIPIYDIKTFTFEHIGLTFDAIVNELLKKTEAATNICSQCRQSLVNCTDDKNKLLIEIKNRDNELAKIKAYYNNEKAKYKRLLSDTNFILNNEGESTENTIIEKFNNMKTLCEKSKNELAVARQNIVSYQSNINNLAAEYEISKSTNSACSENAKNMLARNRKLTAEIASLEENLRNKEQIYSENIKQKIADINAKYTKTHSDFMHAIKSELANVSAAHRGEIEKCKSAINDKVVEIQNLKNDLIVKIRENQKLNSAVKHPTIYNNDCLQDMVLMGQLKEQISRLEAENAQLKK
jgi:hypothetical protein